MNVTDNSCDAAAAGPDELASSVNTARRKFGKASVALSGVLLTLASRPVLGEVRGKSPSGFVSGNVSNHGNPPPCEGRSPGYWKNHPESWPVPIDTKFGAVFNCNVSSYYYTYTLMELVSGCASATVSANKDNPALTCEHLLDPQNLGMHLVASYLNALSGWTPCLNIETIKSMFSEWQNKGTFSPTAGVFWDAAQIVVYLQSTQA